MSMSCQTIHPSPSTTMRARPSTAQHNPDCFVCCPVPTMVEQTPIWHQERRNSTYFPMQTVNSTVQTAPWSIKKNPLSTFSIYLLFVKWSTRSSLVYVKKYMKHDFCNFLVKSIRLNALISHFGLKRHECNVMINCKHGDNLSKVVILTQTLIFPYP